MKDDARTQWRQVGHSEGAGFAAMIMTVAIAAGLLLDRPSDYSWWSVAMGGGVSALFFFDAFHKWRKARA